MGIDVSNLSTLKVKVRRNRENNHMTRVSPYKNHSESGVCRAGQADVSRFGK